ncbi:hypothetical protein [Denitromonas halophila]|uniref:Transcription factor zinc-finger domain-containing protein n=1 Tax=Denitromonas halophila TaxID=1629404 RepID=A0A557QFE9_9RHOO|nr:hypothetical protein [Denitromonas halophila]TVO51629.1 hypothetical protein FHP91_19400 [Denitromonas halophila]
MRQRHLTCPCDTGTGFASTSLSEGLGALQCSGCQGVLIALDDYRRWREHHPDVPAPPAAATVAATNEPAFARPCPACGRPMSRHRVGLLPDFRLDRCSPCQLVWCDDGEWTRLSHARLAQALDHILTDAWQQALVAQENRARREAEIRKRLGDDTYEELQRIRQWLATQPNRVELIGLLSAD